MLALTCSDECPQRGTLLAGRPNTELCSQNKPSMPHGLPPTAVTPSSPGDPSEARIRSAPRLGHVLDSQGTGQPHGPPVKGCALGHPGRQGPREVRRGERRDLLCAHEGLCPSNPTWAAPRSAQSQAVLRQLARGAR